MERDYPLSPEQETNLRTLAAYLHGPKLKARFTMTVFAITDYAEQEEEVDCGTAGCAVGHGPYAGIPKRKGESWFAYSCRVFGLVPADDKTNAPAWNWCFDASWRGYDNTPEGAAKRIEWLLANGVPEGFRAAPSYGFVHMYNPEAYYRDEQTAITDKV